MPTLVLTDSEYEVAAESSDAFIQECKPKRVGNEWHVDMPMVAFLSAITDEEEEEEEEEEVEEPVHYQQPQTATIATVGKRLTGVAGWVVVTDLALFVITMVLGANVPPEGVMLFGIAALVFGVAFFWLLLAWLGVKTLSWLFTA